MSPESRFRFGGEEHKPHIEYNIPDDAERLAEDFVFFNDVPLTVRKPLSSLLNDMGEIPGMEAVALSVRETEKAPDTLYVVAMTNMVKIYSLDTPRSNLPAQTRRRFAIFGQELQEAIPHSRLLVPLLIFLNTSESNVDEIIKPFQEGKFRNLFNISEPEPFETLHVARVYPMKSLFAKIK